MKILNAILSLMMIVSFSLSSLIVGAKYNVQIGKILKKDFSQCAKVEEVTSIAKSDELNQPVALPPVNTVNTASSTNTATDQSNNVPAAVASPATASVAPASPQVPTSAAPVVLPSTQQPAVNSVPAQQQANAQNQVPTMPQPVSPSSQAAQVAPQVQAQKPVVQGNASIPSQQTIPNAPIQQNAKPSSASQK